MPRVRPSLLWKLANTGPKTEGCQCWVFKTSQWSDPPTLTRYYPSLYINAMLIVVTVQTQTVTAILLHHTSLLLTVYIDFEKKNPITPSPMRLIYSTGYAWEFISFLHSFFFPKSQSDSDYHKWCEWMRLTHRGSQYTVWLILKKLLKPTIEIESATVCNFTFQNQFVFSVGLKGSEGSSEVSLPASCATSKPRSAETHFQAAEEKHTHTQIPQVTQLTSSQQINNLVTSHYINN